MLSRSGKVSIRDVAAKAGVSPTTVSQVLNGRDAERFTPGTLERVRTAAEELGYRPHPLARSLIRGRTESIGLMISGLQNPFFVELLEAAVESVIKHDYSPVLNCGPSVDGTYGGHARINEWLVDGVVMWCEGNESLSDYLTDADSNVPVCYISSLARDDNADLIENDIFTGAKTLAEHLVSKGYSKIAYISPFNRSHESIHEKRLSGFEEGFKNAGITFESYYFPTPGPTRQRSLQAGIAMASLPVGRRPDALLCHNDITAVGVIHGLRRAGLRIPENIAVAGLGGTDEGHWLARPLTTVEIPKREICERAVAWLIERIDGYDGPRRHELVEPILRVGETT